MSVAAAIHSFQGLIFPSLRQQAQVRAIHEPLIAVVAAYRGQLIGMVLAEISYTVVAAKILSLFVEPQHRQQGVGQTLLAHLEKILISRGCQTVELTYRADWPSVPAIERLLHRCEWPPPKPDLLLCKSSLEYFANAPLLYELSLPAEFTIFPWSELTSQERAIIQQEQAYPPVLSPFQAEERIEPLNSLGLRYRNEVIGWLITHRIDPDTIQYTSLFVLPKFQFLGRALPLLAEALKRQIFSGVHYSICQVDIKNKAMIEFVRRRLHPYLTSMTVSHYSLKKL